MPGTRGQGGGGSGRECHGLYVSGPEFSPWCRREKLGVTEQTCNPSAAGKRRQESRLQVQ